MTDRDSAKTAIESVLKDGNENLLRDAEWYWIAAHFNAICEDLSSLLLQTTVTAPKELGEDNWLTGGLVSEAAQMESISGLLAIQGVAPSTRTQDMYSKLTDPEGSGLHMARTQAISAGKGLVDEDGKSIVYPTDADFTSVHKLFRFTSGMHKDELHWWLPGAFLKEDARWILAAQAANLYAKVKRWGRMPSAREPAILAELQGLVAQLNAMEEDHVGFVTGLQEQVRRRELDLLQVYLQTHPHAMVPPEVQAELDKIAGGASRRADIERRLTEIRRTEGIHGGARDMHGDPQGAPREGTSGSSSKAKGKARQVD